MASQEDERYDELTRRIERAEILASLAFIGPDRDSNPENREFLRLYFRDYFRPRSSLDKEGRLPYENLEFLIDQLSRTRYSRWERFERDLSQFKDQQSELNQVLEGQIEYVREKLSESISSVQDLTLKNAELSADTHEWLAIQSLGIDAAEVRISRFVPLRVYLSQTPGQAIENVSNAVSKLLEVFDFEISDDFPAIRGSWKKNWFAKTKKAATQPEVMERLKKIEKAVELQGLGRPQADIDLKQAQATATLIQSIESIPDAALQVGSILVVKITRDSKPIIQVRTLTPRELILLENNQALLSSPREILEKLSELSHSYDNLKRLDGNQEESITKRISGKGVKNQDAKENPSRPF